MIIQRLEAEVDELWSFVGKKTNKHWIWIALDVRTRQVIAFHVGDRSRKSAKKLWNNIPEVHRQQATFYTDSYSVYDGVIPQAQHQAISKQARKTNHVERFNGILRQRISRLVRDTLSFLKIILEPLNIPFAITILQKQQHYMVSTTMGRVCRVV